MNENRPDIRLLNDAIDSLNGDAEGMHALVTRSTEELERATREGKRVADLAGEALEALAPMAEELRSAADDAKGTISSANAIVERLSTELTWAQKEGKEAFDKFSAASQEAFAAFRSESLEEAGRTREELLASLGESQEAGRAAFDEYASASLKATEKTRDDLQTDLLSHKTAMAARMDSLEAATMKRLGDLEEAVARLEEAGRTRGELLASLGESQEAGRAAFDEFASTSLKATEKTRDDLQTDLLSHKTAMAARMDSLEAATTKRLGDLEASFARLEEAAKGTGDSLGERIDLLQKKVSLPLYGVIAVAILQLLTIAMLLLR